MTFEIDTIRWHEAAFRQAFEAPNGMTGRDMRRRGRNVEAAAKRQVGVDSGFLRSQIETRVENIALFGGLHAQVGVFAGPEFGLAYWHHEGTRPHIIRPTRAENLRFPGTRGGATYAEAVRHPGTAPNRYLSDNLKFGLA